jgi:hypothetical protein
MCEMALPSKIIIWNWWKIYFWTLECSDPNIICVNSECVETNNPAQPVYCDCYDNTRRDPQKNETCPLSSLFDRKNSFEK